MKKIYSLCLVLLVLTGCSSESLSVKQATSLIQEFTATYPVYESASFALGEQKLRLKKDAAEIEALKRLAGNKLITLETTNLRKKFLSKDSIWEVNVRLTSEASQYVLQQKKNKAEVKTYLFALQDNSEVALKLNGKTKATATAKLIKEPTPFAGISNDKNPNTDFISRDFTLKYKEESGWYVVK